MTTLANIECPICTRDGTYSYTTNYYNTGISGYHCSNCFNLYSESEFAELFPDYDQTGDHDLVEEEG